MSPTFSDRAYPISGTSWDFPIRANEPLPNSDGMGIFSLIIAKKTMRMQNRVRAPLVGFVLFAASLLSFPLDSWCSGKNAADSAVYVGSGACQPCHPGEYKSFMAYAKKSRSFRSIERMKKGLTREEVKQCYSCHTTGYGRRGGFISPEKTPQLKNAGCEVCHGPGSVHVKTEDPKDIKAKLTMKDCEACHTSERIRAFRFRPLIHGGAH